MKNYFVTSCMVVVLLVAGYSLQAQSLKTGDVVEVNYSGHWYKSTVLEVNGDKYKVHYHGYPSSDDAWVTQGYIRTLAADGKPETVTCNFTVPPGKFTNTSPASPELFKRELYDWYQRTITGGISSPTAVGIVYKSFVAAPAYKNTASNVAGRGTMRRHSGAPLNAQVYVVHTTYFVCEQYSSGVTQKQVTADFSFFINIEGEWTCSKDN